MAKQGMARPEHTHSKPRIEYEPVPEIQEKAKHGKKSRQNERADAAYYPAIDNELGQDNLENDFPAADLNAR